MNKLETILQSNPEAIARYVSRRNLWHFSCYIHDFMDMQPFHDVYYKALNKFAHGQIKRLIVSIPPQHGKSLGSSRLLPAFMLGLNPDLKIAVGSYSAAVARDFNRDVQRIIDSPQYKNLFPNTTLSDSRRGGMFQRNSDVCEIVGHKGSFRGIGRGGSLTSRTVDIMVMDDVYKDYEEANSPVIRQKAWKWYTTVVRKRLHNDSQELIVFTRWHKDDLIGLISEKEPVIDVTSFSDFDNIPEGAWLKINFEAIKTGEPTDIDQRRTGAALWESKHSLSKLLAERRLDPVQFECLNQGNPISSEGRLYQPFKTYSTIEEYGVLRSKGNYTDCADEGSDLFCSVCYSRVESPQPFYNEISNKFEKVVYLLVTDVLYTDKPIEHTAVVMPAMLNKEGTEYANIESNAGGKAFSLMVRPKTKSAIKWFHQSKNKESRIITHSALVNNHIIMPVGWQERFPKFYEDVTAFLRNFGANTHDDAADVLTGMVEMEIISTLKPRSGVRVVN